ncbi:MAG TPA: ribosome maturation factor RimP [Rhizomicrobium sp.]|nr:ribosome maturation factor RimP [Rhizomicrobium sp.]
MTFGGSLKGPPRGKDFPWPFGHHEQGRIAILTAMSHLEPIIAPKVESAGYRLVRLRLIGGKRKTLQIMAERPDGQMDVEDCAKLSRALSEFLDAEDPIEGDYVLEVSSPGIDRPLTRITDFARWSGHEAKIELTVPDASGRKRFKGQILGLDGNDVVIDAGGTRVKFPFSGIADAKLVLTDKLIEEDLKAKRTPKQ